MLFRSGETVPSSFSMSRVKFLMSKPTIPQALASIRCKTKTIATRYGRWSVILMPVVWITPWGSYHHKRNTSSIGHEYAYKVEVELAHLVARPRSRAPHLVEKKDVLQHTARFVLWPAMAKVSFCASPTCRDFPPAHASRQHLLCKKMPSD